MVMNRTFLSDEEKEWLNRQEPKEARKRIKHINDFTDYDVRVFGVIATLIRLRRL